MKLIAILLLFTFPLFAKLTNEQKKSLIKTTKWLAKHDLRYAKPWTPPEGGKSINMDCSNTVRYVYKKSIGIEVPSGGSYDIYIYYKKKKLTAFTPLNKDKTINVERLRKKLRSGDLLFWVNTHSDINPNHHPPISHVMIYLGVEKKSRLMKMVGSNTSGHGVITKGGGPDIYVFDPLKQLGCVRKVKSNKKSACIPGKESKFFAYARPVAGSNRAETTSHLRSR
ncbi:MAG: NlpC/P60 family protein [Leptospiraceae bacterium]|nr:NlpC/P60 family protein [Leptospiraceae bacterium]